MQYEVVPEVIKDGRKRTKQFMIVEVVSGKVKARFADESVANDIVYRLNNSETEGDE